ncbi:DNA primase [Noviluteimonas gilva]|uniref:DNA primase n=1 Tax=Noviluteimonas gilva TaxID=2682097 RepID=A0A7C9M3P6_9GAMM|nr:DNA primase [Lysobacter gilvus]MUV14586.1 DNA primase [Lysobacter gilvus]
MTDQSIMRAPLGARELLARLEGVRSTGKGWRARCPACGGKSDKVSVSEADNGATLLHAFCGCSPADVLGAIGLGLADLFPARLRAMTEPERREARRRAKEAGWAAALDVVAREAAIIEIAGRQIENGQGLLPEDRKRLVAACERVGEARTVLNGR